MCMKIPKGLPKTYKKIALLRGQHVMMNRYGTIYMLDENKTDGFWDITSTGKINWYEDESSYITVYGWLVRMAGNKGVEGRDQWLASGGNLKGEMDEPVEIPYGFQITPDMSITKVDKPTPKPMTKTDIQRVAYLLFKSRPVVAKDSPSHPAYNKGKWDTWQKSVHAAGQMCSQLSSIRKDGTRVFDLAEFLKMAGASA